MIKGLTAFGTFIDINKANIGIMKKIFITLIFITGLITFNKAEARIFDGEVQVILNDEVASLVNYDKTTNTLQLPLNITYKTPLSQVVDYQMSNPNPGRFVFSFQTPDNDNVNVILEDLEVNVKYTIIFNANSQFIYKIIVSKL